MSSVYFAHPTKYYNTREEELIQKALAREFGEVINPKDYPPPTKPGHCPNCMEKVMKGHFFPLIDKCENFAIWLEEVTCSIECELYHAAQAGKNLYLVELSPDVEEIDFEKSTLLELSLVRRYQEWLKMFGARFP